MNLLKIGALLLVLSVALHQSIGRTVCGPALDEVLSAICVHGFNTKFKKSMEWDQLANNAVEDELAFPYARFPFLAEIRGGQLNTLAKIRRHRDTIVTGVYDECCNKDCTYNEILSYCNRFE
ncbi:probable insulin-like peptide 1 [Bactrocera dorsalis]|uniref:Probable insulin-like peptide 1 n=1 Tax=Bactrocera dorsalis TaxID=27457 RepID=A0ABM3JZ34_BACDO|nr:probable insulin-like peptide 1 [Bactrocera dorsalis]